jgi:hypothetical protein
MVSKVDICNYALQEVGGTKITTLTENTPNAIECNLRYDTARRALLTMHLWNFATKRFQLNADATGPLFNYEYSFTLPADFLYICMTGLEEQFQSPSTQIVNSNLYVHDVPSYGGIDKYRIEGGKLLSHDSSVNLIYVADEEDTQLFSKTFVELLARFIASKIAYKITGSKSERDTQLQIFEQELSAFQSIDSQQGVFDRLEVSGFLSEMI